MTHILHLLTDPGDPVLWELLSILLKKDSTNSHEICCLRRETADALKNFRGISSHVLPYRPWPLIHWSRRLEYLSNRPDQTIIHAWDLRAATAALAHCQGTPVILSMPDPAQCVDAARWMRSLPGKIVVAAFSQTVRQQLVGAGLLPDRVVVIRGAVDFAAINQAKASNMRRNLGLDQNPVLLFHGPATRGGGQFHGLWAAAIVQQIHRGLRVICPYESREARRLQRFVESIGFTDLLMRVDERHTWTQLAACADVFVASALEDINTEPLAAAMAGGLVIVGTAIRSITELIADRSNGLLVKAGHPTALAARILTGLEDTDLRRKLSETARAQAYEVFGLRSFVDHYARLYDNLRNNRSPGDGIIDTAMAA